MEAVLTQSVQSAVPASNKRRWTGVVLSGLAAAFLLFDAAMKLVEIPAVVEASARIGYPEVTLRPIGFTLLACVVLYLVPRTAILGAVLLTGYLGGAIATHVRVQDALFSHTLFPVYFAALIWGGLYLRNPRARTLAPWSK
jgi:hypothetical protein